MNAEQLVSKHLEAQGGLDKIQAIHSLVQEGTVINGEQTLPLRVCKKRPGYLLVSFLADGQTGREAWDGQAAWEYFPWRDAAPILVSGVPQTALRRASEFDSPLVNWRQKGHQVDYAGESQFAEQHAYMLKVTLADGNEITHYLDRESLLVIGTKTRRGIHGGEPIEISHRFEDYRQVAGVFYAFKMIEVGEEQPHREIVAWNSIEANFPLDDALFQMPPAVSLG
jgi:hypothetical protein